MLVFNRVCVCVHACACMRVCVCVCVFSIAMYSVVDSVYCLAVLERRHLQSYQDAFSVRWGRQGMRWWSHTWARSASGSYLTP